MQDEMGVAIELRPGRDGESAATREGEYGRDWGDGIAWGSDAGVALVALGGSRGNRDERVRVDVGEGVLQEGD